MIVQWFKDKFMKRKCSVCLNIFYKFRTDWIVLKFSDGTFRKMRICPDCASHTVNLKVKDLP